MKVVKRLSMTRRKHGWIIIITLAIAAVSPAVEPDAKTSIENARTAYKEWIENQRIISKEKQDWALGREILNERIKLVENEIASLRKKIEDANESISDADIKRTELVDENDKLKGTTETLKGIVSRLEARTIALDKQLPDSLRGRVKPLSQSIPEDPNETKLSLSQRFLNVIGILNEVNKFNREITPTPEMRTLSDGSVAEVTTLYLGLGQAYYVGANGTIAGVGRPSENGWTWESANDAANGVADAVAVMKNEKVASFIPLPVKVK